MKAKKTTAFELIKGAGITPYIKNAAKKAHEKAVCIDEFKKLGLSQEFAEKAYWIACDFASLDKLTLTEAAEKLIKNKCKETIDILVLSGLKLTPEEMTNLDNYIYGLINIGLWEKFSESYISFKDGGRIDLKNPEKGVEFLPKQIVIK